ncbi:DUF397 domain-containing protein [Streptomyces sp. NPDC058295]|uniref:DUF397 domain-containing protein n=1 Tax=Streptomyces sp. NPDC058295 TaxID=3346431 RepID=UPI0036E3553F
MRRAVTTPGNWQKSSFSGGSDGNNCLELTSTTADALRLRESDSPTTILTTTPAALAQFLSGIRRLGAPVASEHADVGGVVPEHVGVRAADRTLPFP